MFKTPLVNVEAPLVPLVVKLVIGTVAFTVTSPVDPLIVTFVPATIEVTAPPVA